MVLSVTCLLGCPFLVHCILKGRITMDIVTGRLEVFFEAPFWVGIFEQVKQERKEHFHKKREAEKQFQFELKQQKRKEKHKGR